MTIPVRLRHGGPHHRLPRRFVAAGGAALDDVLLVLPFARPDAGDDLGLRGARLGRLVGLGFRSRTRARCRGSRPPRSCTPSWCRSGAACSASGTSRWSFLAFVLTLFATAMTRTGIVQSVHAFGEDPELAMMFGIFIAAVVVVSFGLVTLPPAPAARAQRARIVGLARGGLPGQQLDPALLGVLHPVRHDVPDPERGRDRAADHRRAAVLQQVDDPDRPRAAAPDRDRTAAGVAEVHARQPARPVPLARRAGRRHGPPCSTPSASASGSRASASRSAPSSWGRSDRSSCAVRSFAAASPAPISPPR